MITQRQEQLVVRIIDKYIKLAEPISSKFLEKSGFFGLSSATIRAEMNELEGLGYLAHPHTSGGRVPTDRGYRYYVDNLENQKPKIKNQKYEHEIRTAMCRGGNDPRQINKFVAQTLSELSDNLVVANIEIEEEDEFFKTGLASLFEMPEFREFDRIFRMTNFFDEFDNIFGEIERAFFTVSAEALPNNREGIRGKTGDDVKIFIGRENPIRDIRDETVMFAKYNLPQGCTGSLTLIGPTRMDYEKNIGLIKYATKELNKLSKSL
ncbi:MAG: hypothetical protein HY506_00600 [Candidatus Yanofskybacteria bacterium]|nr:hypothetical protein [Candidatus Yanofskybacteria bacterium]